MRHRPAITIDSLYKSKKDALLGLSPLYTFTDGHSSPFGRFDGIYPALQPENVIRDSTAPRHMGMSGPRTPFADES